MKILIVSATPFECFDFREMVSSEAAALAERGLYIDFLIGGVGMLHTSVRLMDYLQSTEVDVAIQMGVAGSFREELPPLALVQVVSEAFGDMGAEEERGNLDLFEMNLWEVNEPPFENKLLFAPELFPLPQFRGLPEAHGITVNMTSGRADTIAVRRKKFAADIESMEGAAFHFICRQKNIPFRQIRCISNRVTPRDTSAWKMKQAIEKLNQYFIEEFF